MSKPLSFLIIFSFLFLSVKGANVQHITSLRRLSSTDLTKRGERCKRESKNDSAIIYLTIVADRAMQDNLDKNEHRLTVKAMVNLCAIYSFHDFEKSYFYLKKALTIAEKYRYNDLLPPLYINMGCISHSLNNMGGFDGLDAETNRYFHKAFYSAIKENNQPLIFSSFTNIANIALGVDATDSIADILISMDSIDIIDNTKLARIALWYKEGISQFCDKNYMGSIESFRKIEFACQDTPFFRLLALCSIANVFATSKNYRNSIDISLEALNVAKDIGDQLAQLSLLKDLKNYSDSIGDPESANRYYMQYVTMQDSININNNLSKIPRLQIEDEIRESNWIIQTLNYKNRMQRTIVISVLVITLIAIVFLWIIYIKNKNLKKRNTALFCHNEEILKERDEKLKLIAKYELKLNQKCDSETKVKEELASIENANKKYRNSNLSADMMDEIVNRVKLVMQNAEEICCESFSLDRLSDLIGWKKNYISQALSERVNQNFNSLLAESRIMIVCRKIRDDNMFVNLSIEAIAESVGFKSRSNFSVVFKRITGLSPSEYIKLAKIQQT